MQFISTRGQAQPLSFCDVVLTGLASDGGLYVPDTLPKVSQETLKAWATLSYKDLAFEVMSLFVGDELSDDTLRRLIDTAYRSFRHSAIAPLVQTDHNEYILELFHGPTLAFKDFALQFLGQLLNELLRERQQKAVVMGATSGDTGSAAIAGCLGCEYLDIFILHPHERVSEVQRRQMTTVLANNVHNIALQGNFDDCQSMVKASFADQSFLPDGRQLVAVNSINWARIMAQIVYYFYAGLALGAHRGRTVSFSVPTGNFGDIFAGYLAKRMGLPVDQLMVATNQNDILHRCISANDHSKQALQHSLSPSMDIMVSSNFERLLFDVYDRNGSAVSDLIRGFQQGAMPLSDAALQRVQAEFTSGRLDDAQMLNVIKTEYERSGYLLDPHTAIGLQVGRDTQHRHSDSPLVNLATAHPAKFPSAIQSALPTVTPSLPPHMGDLFDKPERFQVLANDLEQVKRFMVSQL